ncbi:M1 family aminopeptidase [Rufibacter immobilis]|nr:M1 family aminopeptidase [Rufibacter immobilis]
MKLLMPVGGLIALKRQIALFLVLASFSFVQFAHAQRKATESCAAARMVTTPMLLADGITSEAHKELMRHYDLHWYKLDLQLENNSVAISGNVILSATSMVSSLTHFAFELHPNFTIEQVLAEGVPCTFERTGSEVVAVLPSAKGKQETVEVQVFYSGRAPTGAASFVGNGFSTAATPWGSVTWSLSEPFAASEWFPSKQLLEDKADSVDVWVTTSVANKVGSNGVLQRVTPMGNQKHRYEWKSKYPIAYYLISVAVGPYEEYSFRTQLPGMAEPVLVQNYIYPGILASMKTEIDRTGQLLQLFSELYGIYPFHREKYGHSMAPMGGGMEHQTMTTQSTFEFSLTAHELAHQWWGDEVTCAGWSHIWLNEGFASYSEYIAYERLMPANSRQWLEMANQNSLRQPQGSVFVTDSTNVSRIFSSSLTYDKGALVLHMLRHALQNDALFFQILRTYRDEFKYKVANTRDFQHVVERVSGRSFQYFFDQWVYGQGYPIFDISWAQAGNTLQLRSRQHTSSKETPLFRTEVEFRIRMGQKDTLVLVQQEENLEDYVFKVSGTVTGIEVDPNQWLLEAVNAVQYDATLLPGQLLAYPNPTTGQFYLKGNRGVVEEVAVFDVLGRHIRTIRSASSAMSLADLGAGTYVLKVKAGGEMTEVKIVKL